MRHMSFFLTTQQVRERTKTVTRRLGWAAAKHGDIVQPVMKGQGLKKGEKVEKIGPPILFLRVTRERLDAIEPCDVAREGFAGMSAAQFVAMFCTHNDCEPHHLVTRIHFEYL